MSMPIAGPAALLPHIPATPVRRQADAAAMLLDGAEELGFGIAAPRPPGRRAISKFTTYPRRSKLNQVLALLESGAVGAAGAGRYARLQKLSKGAQTSGDDIEVFLKSNGLSPEDSMLLLQQILNDMDAQGEQNPSLRLRVETIQQALDEDQGLEIRARMHALEVSLQEGLDGVQTVNFQDGYLAMILSSGSCALVLDELLRRFHDRLRRALRLLVKTLGREIDSQWASCERDYLHLLRQALYELGGIANTYDDCETLAQRWKEKDALLCDDPVLLTRELVRIAAEPWVGGTRFTSVAEKYSTAPWHLSFLGRLRSIIHGMPYRLFIDEAAQDRVYEAIQRTLDDAAAQERF